MSELIAVLRQAPRCTEPEVLEETALAMAQAVIEGAIKNSGYSRAEVARRMGRPRSYISRILSGRHNLTVRTFARALAACGYEVNFGAEHMNRGWSTKSQAATWRGETLDGDKPDPSAPLCDAQFYEMAA